ncbi:hypothetical protein PIB30_068449, partial [Stylosanthes scabra]|nr:hypothetical protein [Stylosanthes scabra]
MRHPPDVRTEKRPEPPRLQPPLFVLAGHLSRRVVAVLYRGKPRPRPRRRVRVQPPRFSLCHTVGSSRSTAPVVAALPPFFITLLLCSFNELIWSVEDAKLINVVVESCCPNTRASILSLRRSPRFVKENVSAERQQNDEKESRNDKPSNSVVRKNEGGEKARRKRKCGKETAEGWAKEQELALQRAFFSVKPSPDFWKNVSKMVPGKSQQDCFDRIHGDHVTPPQLHPRSRARTVKSLPIQQFSMSASKLFKPTDKKVRGPNILKPKNCITQKSVEKLLQHRLQVNQDCRGDIFSILEPDIDFSTNASQPSVALSTPKKQKENKLFLQGCTETSSSSHKKSLSRFSSSHITNLVSPPVLKQVKNKGMHEKYINQLRCREARRKANSARLQIPVTGKIIQKGDVVKAAKVALASEARDAINKFQQSQ